MSKNLVSRVSDRIYVDLDKAPSKLRSAIRKAFTHKDPRYGKKRGQGFSTYGQSSVIKMWSSEEGNVLSVPRGGAQRLREVAQDFGMVARFVDARVTAPIELPPYGGHALRPYQAAAVRTAVSHEQGIIRAPTGSGKSLAALALLAELGQRSMVIVADQRLMLQWVQVISWCFGLTPKQIGLLGASKQYRPGCPIVVAMQQTLYRNDCAKLKSVMAAEPFGAVIIDECQTVAASTFQSVVDCIPAKYRIGFSADETRRDRMEFLIYDVIGQPIYEVSRDELIDGGVIHAVDACVVPTGFEADWYVHAEPSERNFTQLVTEISEDEERNDLLLSIVCGIVNAGDVPAMVFVHRRDHAAMLGEALRGRGIRTAVLLGGAKKAFKQGVDGLRDGDVQVAVGTYRALGTGIDIPVLRAGVCATPISRKNAQFFNQVRGRICRTTAGKHDASLYYLWDMNVFDSHLGVLEGWNDGRVTVLADGRWVTAREWIRYSRRRSR